MLLPVIAVDQVLLRISRWSPEKPQTERALPPAGRDDHFARSFDKPGHVL